MFKQARNANLLIVIGSDAQRGFSNYASKSFMYIHWVQQLFESKIDVMTLLVGGIWSFRMTHCTIVLFCNQSHKIHSIPQVFTGLFAIDFGDHLRSRIICGLGIICGWGSFAILYSPEEDCGWQWLAPRPHRLSMWKRELLSTTDLFITKLNQTIIFLHFTSKGISGAPRAREARARGRSPIAKVIYPSQKIW